MEDKEFYKIESILENQYGNISKIAFLENEVTFAYEKDNCKFEMRFDTEHKDICTVCFRNSEIERPVCLNRNDFKTYLKCLDVLGW